MPIFSFISQCFVHSVSENHASVAKNSEAKDEQLIQVNLEVASNRCSPVSSVSVVSDPPVNHVQSVSLDSVSHGNRGKIFEYSELKEATDNFDCNRKLGRGNYGTVYLGIFKDGYRVAIKQVHEERFKTLKLNDEKLQSEKIGELVCEVTKLTSMSHDNLVRLYGCTSSDTCDLLLVQEYISNGTLANLLLRALQKPGELPWDTRLDIAIQTASALAYLHASDVIHRDIKTSNILLDDSFKAKVADYGLTHLFPLGDVTHITTDPAGSPGYIDPEYYEHCHLSDKSDVYSFGVVLLELISSLPAFYEEDEHPCLADFAIEKIPCGQLRSLVDPTLGFESDEWVSQTVTSVAGLAFVCLQRHRDMRPSMAEVLDKLKRIKGTRSQSGRSWNPNS